MAPKPEEIIDSTRTTQDEYTNNTNSTNTNNGYINNAFENDKSMIEKNLTLNNNLSLTNNNNNNNNNNSNNGNEKSLTKTGTEGVAVSDKPPSMDFDDLLPHIGEFGKYQKILFLLMIPYAFFVAFVYFSQIFITVIPDDHWCKIPELEHLSVKERLALAIPKLTEGSVTSDGYSKCSMYAVNFTEILTNNGTLKVADPNWPIQPCTNGWEFDHTEIPYKSIATELEWVCENDALATYAQAIFFCGAIVGGLLFGWIADRFGRIPALAGCNLVGFVAGVATAFTGSFWSFTFCRFVVGFAFDNCFTMMYILVLEYVGPKWRTFVANMSIAIFFTGASCLLPWIAYWLADWRMLAIVTSAPLFLAIFTPWVVPESARWLVSQGQTAKAISILKKFERINGSTVKPELYQEFSDSCKKMQEDEANNNNYSILDLFKTPRLRKITITLIVIWMAVSLVFDGHIRNVGSLGLNVFVTFTVAAATELPADVFLTYVLDIWGRRWLACSSMVLSGVFSIAATAVPVGVPSAVLAIMGRFCVNISYNIGLQYAAELLPTVVRAQGVAFIHIMGYVASIIAPFIVYLSLVSPSLPLLILGIVGVFGGILSLFLPETLDEELPTTLNDGEQFGINQKFLDMPCTKKQINDDDDEEKQIKQFQRSNGLQGSMRGASLRASTRGELGSSMLQRSVRSRRSAKSVNTPL